MSRNNVCTAQEIIGRLKKLGVPDHLLTVEDICLGNADMLFSTLSYLFCTCPMLQSTPSPWQVALSAIERAIPAWRLLCRDWGIVFEADPTKDEEAEEVELQADGASPNGASSAFVAKPYRPQVILAPASKEGSLDGSQGSSQDSSQDSSSSRLVDDARVSKVAKQVLAACSAAKQAILQRNETVRIWELVRERVRYVSYKFKTFLVLERLTLESLFFLLICCCSCCCCFFEYRSSAWNCMLQKSIQKPIEFVDRKAVREYHSFTRLRGFQYGGNGSKDVYNIQSTTGKTRLLLHTQYILQ